MIRKLEEAFSILYTCQETCEIKKKKRAAKRKLHSPKKID